MKPVIPMPNGKIQPDKEFLFEPSVMDTIISKAYLTLLNQYNN